MHYLLNIIAKKHLHIFIILVFLFIIIRIPFLNKEFTYEEPHIIKSAIAISQNGYPIIYIGEQNQDNFINLWKPPTLVFILGGFFKIFGISEITARTVPLLFSLGQLILIYLFCLKFFKEDRRYIIGLLASFLFVINPFSIQNSIQVDIDGGVLSFFAILFMYISLVFLQKDRLLWSYYLIWIASFALLFGTKFEPALMLAFVIFLYAIFTKSEIKKIFSVVFISLIGVGLFFLLFYLYNLSFNHLEKTMMPVDVITGVFSGFFMPKVTDSSGISGWGTNFFLVGKFITWITIPFVLLFISSVINFFYEKKYKDHLLLFLSLWILIVGGVYSLFGWYGAGYPRYFAPIIPPLFIFIGFTVDYAFKNYSKKYNKHLFLAMAVLGFIYLLNKDFLVFFERAISVNNLPFLGILALIYFTLHYFRNVRLLIPIFIIIWSAIICSFIYIHDLKAPYSLTNLYGQYGFKNSGQYLKNNLNENDIIFTIDPIGYYYGRKFYDANLIIPYKESKEKFFKEIIKNEIKAVALPTNYLKKLFIDNQQNFEEYINNNTYFTKIEGTNTIIFIKK